MSIFILFIILSSYAIYENKKHLLLLSNDTTNFGDVNIRDISFKDIFFFIIILSYLFCPEKHCYKRFSTGVLLPT